MNEFYIRNVLEAALLAAGKPLQLAELSQLFDETARPKTEDIRAALDALANEYSSRGVEVKETAAGFRIQVRREFSAEVSRLWPERPVRYSRALLETLALIAYRQPITRAEIEAVRGVAVNPNIIKTVIERNWVRVVGHRDVPGRPELLGTTREFLDYFGLRSLDELPPLAEIKALGDYNPQLELPGEATPALEGPAGEGAGGADGADNGVAAVAVAGLLTSEGGATDVVASDPAVTSDAMAADAITSDVVASGDVVSDAIATDAAAPEADGADVQQAEARIEAVEAQYPLEVSDDAISTAGSSVDADGSAEVLVEGPAASELSANAEGESDAEAERTLAASENSNPRATAETEDAEASSMVESSESLDALDDAVDEDADEDELSADGHGSRELVAAPRDLDN